jgi:hypothetical protein
MSDRPRKHSPSAVVTTSRTHEQRAKEVLRDALFALLRSAATDPGRPAICHTADALRQVFLEGELDLVWALVEHRTGRRVRTEAARCTSPGLPSMWLPQPEVDDLLDRLPTVEPALGAPLRASLLCTDAHWVLVLVRQPSGCLIDLDERLWLALPLQPRTADLTVRRAWFAAFDQGWRELVDTLRALQSIDRHAWLERRVDAAAWQRVDLPLDERLRRANDLLTTLLYEIGCDDPQHHYLALATRLGERVLQITLGNGALVHSAPRHEEPAHRIALGLLRAASIGETEAAPNLLHALRLRLLALTLRAHPETEAPPTADLSAWRAALDDLRPRAEAAGLHAAWLLAAWSGVHRALHAPGLPPLAEETLWAWVCAATPPMLAGIFEAGHGRIDRNRLALWFCTSLLGAASGPQVRPGPHRNRTRQSLGWVMRESLRQLEYAHRTDFLWQPERFAAAMLDLVEIHAHDVLGLPHPLDVRGTLSQLGEAGGADERVLTSAHRQHVLEVYLVGHFLLELQPSPTQSGPTPVEALLAGADPTTLRRAWSLAALYHDVGISLMQRISTSDPWPEHLPLPLDVLQVVRQARQTGRTALLERCRRDLDTAPLGTFPARAHPSDGLPEDHGLIGAWVLWQLGAAADIEHEVLHPALRAIVLHAHATEPIQLGEDPIAALLVLADQLFEWEPTVEALPDPRAVSGDEHHLATFLGPRHSRTAELRLPGLRVESDGLTLIARLAPSETWPEVHLRLHHADVSGVPTWRSWLSISQGLGRIRAAPGSWSPTVTLRSPIPSWLREKELDTHAVLLRVAWGGAESGRSLAMSLRPWLERADRFVKVGDEEELKLHPLRHHGDVRLEFAELAEALETVTANTRT